MNYAIIDNGTVINIAEASAEFAASQGWINITGATIGGRWDGTTFTPPPVPPPVVPQSISMSQARSVLISTNNLSTVINALNAMIGTEGELARSEFEYAQTVDRYRALTLQMQAVLNLTDKQMDDMFIRAKSL
jgi:hypothetical protein